MLTTPFQPISHLLCPSSSMAFAANPSTAWTPSTAKTPFATIPTRSTTSLPTPSDHVHFVQSHAKRNDPASVLGALDLFAVTTSTSSTPTSSSLNPKAELIIDEVLLPFTPGHQPSTSDPLIMLEPLGVSSLGYSALWFATVLSARFGRANVRYIAVESDPERAFAAQQIVKHAGLADVIQVVLGSVQEQMQELPRRSIWWLLMKPEEQRGLRLDALYFAGARGLMESGRLVKGSIVIADNLMELGPRAEYGQWAETNPGLESRRYEMMVNEDEDKFDAVEVSVVL